MGGTENLSAETSSREQDQERDLHEQVPVDDEETQGVLDQFKTLFSPAILTDQKEREAMETVFSLRFDGVFSIASFTSFVTQVYNEPDTVISEETKQRIEREFKIPRQPIRTGEELVQVVLKTDESGEPIYQGEDNAVEYRSGLKAFADEHGQMNLLVENGARTLPVTVPSTMMGNSEQIAHYANYTAIRQIIFEEMHQLTNLFGGGMESSLNTPDNQVIHRAQRFVDVLLPNPRQPGELIAPEDLHELRLAFRAMLPAEAESEADATSALEELGVTHNGDVQFARWEQVASVLRANDYFRAQNLRGRGFAYNALQEELAKAGQSWEARNHDESPIQEHSSKATAFRISGHLLSILLGSDLARAKLGYT